MQWDFSVKSISPPVATSEDTTYIFTVCKRLFIKSRLKSCPKCLNVVYFSEITARTVPRSNRLRYLGRVTRVWYLSPMRAAKVQASLRIRAVSPEPPLLGHTSTESRGTFRQKARSLAPLNGWACADKICHDGMLEDTNSLVPVTVTSLRH